MQNHTLLTGIKPTGTPHIGNFLGAIEPAIQRAHNYEQSFVFIADYHALNTVQDGARLRELSRSIAATWIACGLDTTRTTLYRQSSVPAVFELETVLNAVTPKGWMNKAHAYKAAVDVNTAESRDRDDGVSMGLYTYPILMAADILLYNANLIPVGKDQVQHVEIARDIAQRFNHTYSQEVFTLPEASVVTELESVIGLDGRKMSKSYGNVLPLFATADEWRKLVNKIPTDSLPVEAPKEVNDSAVFALYEVIATPEQSADVRSRLAAGGMGWGEVKGLLVEALEARFGGYRQRYEELMAQPEEIDRILAEGATKAQAVASQKLQQVRRAIGA